MQPSRLIVQSLAKIAERSHRIFALTDLASLLPDQDLNSFKSIIARLEKRGDLVRICRSIYILPDCTLKGSDLLGPVAARLRAGQFNYLSLETVLSEAGIIAQIPVNRITLMSSGRSSIIDCGTYGTIEFVHTRKKPAELAGYLVYDARLGLWRAAVPLALRDMKDTRRDTGLVNMEAAHEFI